MYDKYNKTLLICIKCEFISGYLPLSPQDWTYDNHSCLATKYRLQKHSKAIIGECHEGQ